MTKRQQRSGDDARKDTGKPAPVVYTEEDVERIRKEYDAKFSEMESRILKTIEKAVGPKPSEGMPLRIPMGRSSINWIEKATPGQLIELIGSSLAEGTKKPDDNTLFMAWGTLFSDLFLSSSDLQTDIDTISEEDRDLLKKVIHEDCARSGKFVFSIIKKGANLDRSALVMIASLNDLARVEQDGEPALLLLMKTCDKSIRPALIVKAGKTLLAGIYDSNGVPLIFTVFGLSDLSVYDIDAIDKVLTKEQLKKIVPKSGLGRNALDTYTEIATRMRENLAHQRKSFMNARVAAPEPEKSDFGPHEQDDDSSGVLVHANTAAKPKKAGTSPSAGQGAPAAAGPDEPNNKAIKILIVDDSRIIRNLMVERLHNLGYVIIIQAESGDEAVTIARETHPYVIFMDINMPGKRDGIDAAREIMSEIDTRIIFLTSACNKKTIDRAKGVNPQGYILKPFSERDIRIALTLLY